jgi:CubicO group peptidase (beta-lactamase class C family)
VIRRFWFAVAIVGLLWGCGEPPVTTELAADDVPGEVTPEIDTAQVRIGLASSAMRLCSAVFVSGRTPEHVFAEELEAAAAQGLSFSFGRDPDTVVASAAGETVTVLHRPHLGCTLVQNTTVEALLSQYDAATFPRVVERDAGAPWPQGDRVVLPGSEPGVDLDAVHAAVDAAFDDAEARTRAVVVVHGGRIIAERYAPPFDAHTPQLGWSMTKTVTNALTGILVQDGVLDVNAPAPVAAWQAAHDPRRDITLEHLLRMSSGLAFSEVYSAGSQSDVIDMLFADGAYATGEFAASMPLHAAPGTVWSYSSGTTNLISMLQRQTFDSVANYLAFPRERLFNRLKMASAVIEPDASGVFVGSSYMYATARDWARFGLLYLQDGVWQGERILPEGWVDYSLTPAPAAANGQYGAQIWLNRGNAENPDERPHPTLPAEMFYLSGFEGQNVVVVPSKELIVVRMGLTRTGSRLIWTLTEQVLGAID